tara:strand:- start:367 stop:468 length:102 start_codon:yes stop_codon:yes gene_type:complete
MEKFIPFAEVIVAVAIPVVVIAFGVMLSIVLFT